MDCLFCKIINGDIPSKKLYEDDKVYVFMDIDPLTNGHCLIIPKEHLVTVDEISNELMCNILNVIKKIKLELTEKLSCDGLSFMQNNGYGQEVKHFHIHLVPRYDGDKLVTTTNTNMLVDVDDAYHQIMD